ncbi:MAG: DUF4383 domain-containing protein [Solirubrobacteraceae bacterium]
MAHSATGRRAAVRDRARTPAQWYCLVAGLALLLAGILGFLSDASFDTGNAVQGDKFLGFEVNAIHNLVHAASGLLLLAASPRRASARVVALGFGLVYGLVAIIGLIDGEDVLGIIPIINGPDNMLHVALAALGVITALISRNDDRGRGRTVLEREPDDRRFSHGEPTTTGTAQATDRR